MTLYTVVFKLVSSQPDIPWGILKTKGPLSEENLSDSLYIDGYDLAWGEPSPEASASAKWEKPPLDLLMHERGSMPYPHLCNLTLEEIRRTLPNVFSNLGREWENKHMIPYLIAFFEVEASRETRKNSAGRC